MEFSKQILATLRGGDFAHPGEIEAIELAMQPIQKNVSMHTLDVGSGLGGTAHYVQQQGWGEVVGIDIDEALVRSAQKNHPDVQFIHGDVLKASHHLPSAFQLIYAFTVFFCLRSQQDALNQLAKLAAPNCELILFDYSRFDETTIPSPFPWSKTASHFKPIFLPELKNQLEKSGWHFKKSRDITVYFCRWYKELLQQFALKQEAIIMKYGEKTYTRMYTGYKELLDEIIAGRLGGVIVYAQYLRT